MTSHQRHSKWKIRGNVLPAILCLILLAFFTTSVRAQDSTTMSRIEQFDMAVPPGSTFQKYSVIKQVGHHNQAWVSQSASARYQQGAVIYQNGHDHQARISQKDANALGVITQNGSQHVASIYQNGNGMDMHLEASITQFGTNGRVEITQSSSDQGVSVVQHAYSGSALPVIIETYR